MNNKKLQVWLPLLFSIVMIAGMFLGYKMRDNMPGKSFFYVEKRRPLQEIMDLIKNKYVDDVNIESLSDTAIQAMLSKLDPHSVFIPAEELQEVNEELAGKFYGIGVEFNIFDDTLNVTNVLKDGPSYKAGILTGDKFIKVGDVPVAGKKIESENYRKLLRGDRGTKVTITVMRAGSSKQLLVTRDAIPVSSVDASYIISPGIGFIRLNKFTTQTYREFMESLEDLKKQGAKKLVLDLRGNGGGILEEAIEIADEFLEGDKLITYTEGKHTARKEYRCRRQGQFEQGEVIILADEGSASASEVLMGALQDWDRATIVGRRSFGKGLVQDQFDLSDRSALRLTIARYYTPIGRSIQRPYDQGGKAYYSEISKRFVDGETNTADSVKNDKTKIFKTSSGKTVYGGGGITPDVFVALDTTAYSSQAAMLYSKGSIPAFAYKFYLQHQADFSRYKTASDFVKGFTFTEDNWKEFTTAVAKDSIQLNNISAKEKTEMTQAIRSSIARMLWRYEGLYEVLNSSDDAIKKSLDILSK